MTVLSALCQKCKEPCTVVSDSAGTRFLCACTGRPKPDASAGHRGPTGSPTDCDCGRRHASKGEARVCGALRAGRIAPGQLLYHQVRFPLLNLGPSREGTALYVTVDFVIVDGHDAGDGVRFIAIDAKHPVAPRSAEWRRGAAAFHGAYGQRIREVWVNGKGEWIEEATHDP